MGDLEDLNIEEETGSNTKFIIGGLLIFAAIVFLIVSSTKSSAEYFLTVDEVFAKKVEMQGRKLRVSGAVVGDTIKYEPQTLMLTFEIAHVPADDDAVREYGGLAKALHQAVIDPQRNRLKVVFNGPKPDLMKNEVQVIMTGQMGDDGVFHADEVLTKCPTKYEEAVPDQVDN